MPTTPQKRAAAKAAKPQRGASHGEIGDLVRRQRQTRKLTLEGLGRLSGVSRAAISKIERGEVSATTPILGKLAEALDLTISQLIGGVRAKAVLHIPPSEQPVFEERSSGYERRSLSPLYRGRGIDFVLNTLPPRAKTGPFPAHRAGVEEHLYVTQGRLRVTLGGEVYDLDPGHVLFYPGDLAHTFENLSGRACEYFIVIDSSRLR